MKKERKENMEDNGIGADSPSTADKPDTTPKTIKDVYDNRIYELSEFIRATMHNVQIAIHYHKNGKFGLIEPLLQSMSDCLSLAGNTLKTIKDLSSLARFPNEYRE